MKNFEFDLGAFKIDFGNLWSQPAGPRWSKSIETRISEADKALRKKFQSKEIGFYDWPPSVSAEEKEKTRALAKQLRSQYEKALLIGIGGSYLGPAAVHEALRSDEEKASFPLRWLSNVDPAAIRSTRYFIANSRVATVVISKSGNTTETLSGFFHLSQQLDPRGFVLITDPEKGFLRELARKHGWHSLPVPSNIGGRFSVLTAVGLLPMELGGISMDDVLEGAIEIRQRLESFAPPNNPAYLLAMAFYLWDAEFGHSIQYLMPYWGNLKLMADWFVQLWAESLGKKIRSDPGRSVGFTPVSALGTMDQHSMLQLFKEGPNNKVIGFVDVLGENQFTTIGSPSFNAGKYEFLTSHSFEEVSHLASLATEKSLNNSKVPTYRLKFPSLNARALGAMFFFWETACALAGELYGVNAFDQPGVEESKKILRQML